MCDERGSFATNPLGDLCHHMVSSGLPQISYGCDIIVSTSSDTAGDRNIGDGGDGWIGMAILMTMMRPNEAGVA